MPSIKENILIQDLRFFVGEAVDCGPVGCDTV
jgi:hypothetical protein